MTLHEVYDRADENRQIFSQTSFFGPHSQDDTVEHSLIEPFQDDGGSPSPKDCATLGSVWRDYLAQSGIAAAIIHCEALTGETAALSFFVGFDSLRRKPGMTSELLTFAQQVWHHDSGKAGCEPDEMPSGGSDAASSDLSRALAPFAHVAALHHRTGDYAVHALFLREGPAGEFTSELLATLKLTLPLFLCSASRQTALNRLQRQSSIFKGMIDWLDLGMLLLDERGHVVTSNVAGEALFTGERLLRRSSDGSVVCRRPAETSALRDAIEQVCGKDHASRSQVVVKIGESEDRCRLGFVMSAAPDDGGGTARHALLLVLPCRPATASKQMLDVLGLLPSEQRFLLSFLDASSLSEGAAKAGVSDETAKTYLKRIRCKLGVHRQIELAQLIYGQSPPLRTRFDLMTHQPSETSNALL